MSKECQEKHNKYNEFYKNNSPTPIYWGLGIENESYLMFKNYINTTKDLMIRRHKPERYSVNYYRNYNNDILYHTLDQLPDEMLLPIYINSYLFQKADINGEHMTVYSKENYINKKFNGTTIDMYMKENSEIYNKLFEKNMVFDGDTFEFTTFNFYNAKVKDVIKELKDVKKDFIKEINSKLVGKGIFKDEIIYPPMNHGFVRFNSNINNLGICNNGTYHINITIPTELDSNGNIKDLKLFKSVHMNAIRAIQWLEPILICIYGTPDILSKYNNNYSMGSLRLMMSRYIGAGTYDTDTGIPGKLLNCCKQPEWYKTIHMNSPYIPPETIGYDINYNKFQKHGIELRIFDYFPEEYLEDVINLIILVCHHSIKNTISKPQNHNEFIYGLMASIRYGRRAQIPRQYINTLYEIFDIHNNGCFVFIKKPNTMLEHINYIAKQLRKRYYNKGMTKMMSPNMKPINITFPQKAIEIISHNYTESLL
jgi:hypothetical protein